MILATGTVSPEILDSVIAVAVIFGLATIVLAGRGRARQMNVLGVWGILAFTYREAIRTKWVITFGIIFFLLAVDIPDLYLAASGNLPPEYLPANLTDLLTVTFPLIPLLALPMGATTIVDERESGTLQYLLSNPVTKMEFFLGKAVGLLFATTTVIVIGFGAAAVVTYSTGVSSYFAIIMIMLFAGLLNAVMMGIALIISEFSKRKATAMGIGIMVWFLLAVVSSLDQLVLAVTLKLGASAAIVLVLLDPISMASQLTIYGTGQGITDNAALLVKYVWKTNAYEFLLISVLGWIAITFAVGFLVFRHQDAA